MSYARYTHDCPRCHFLGQHQDQDLYFCEQGQRPTVIARFSSKPSDYESGIYGSFSDGALAVARQTAQTRGLLAYPWRQALPLLHAETPQWVKDEFLAATEALPLRQLAQRLVQGVAVADDCETCYQQSRAEFSDPDTFWSLTNRFVGLLSAHPRAAVAAMLPVSEWSLRYDIVEA